MPAHRTALGNLSPISAPVSANPRGSLGGRQSQPAATQGQGHGGGALAAPPPGLRCSAGRVWWRGGSPGRVTRKVAAAESERGRRLGRQEGRPGMLAREPRGSGGVSHPDVSHRTQLSTRFSPLPGCGASQGATGWVLPGARTALPSLCVVYQPLSVPLEKQKSNPWTLMCCHRSVCSSCCTFKEEIKTLPVQPGSWSPRAPECSPRPWARASKLWRKAHSFQRWHGDLAHRVKWQGRDSRQAGLAVHGVLLLS